MTESSLAAKASVCLLGLMLTSRKGKVTVTKST